MYCASRSPSASFPIDANTDSASAMRAEHTAETSGVHTVDMIQLCPRSRVRRSVQCGTESLSWGRLGWPGGTKMLDQKVIGRIKPSLCKTLPFEDSRYFRFFRPIASFMANFRDCTSSDL